MNTLTNNFIKDYNQFLDTLKKEFIEKDLSLKTLLKEKIVKTDRLAYDLFFEGIKYYKPIYINSNNLEDFFLSSSHIQYTRLMNCYWTKKENLKPIKSDEMLFDIVFENPTPNFFNYAFFDGICEYLRREPNFIYYYNLDNNTKLKVSYEFISGLFEYVDRSHLYGKLHKAKRLSKLPSVWECLRVLGKILPNVRASLSMNLLIKLIDDRLMFFHFSNSSVYVNRNNTAERLIQYIHFDILLRVRDWLENYQFHS